MRSALIAASWAQAVLIAKSLDGNRPSPESFAWRMRSSTRAWARWRAWQERQLPGGGVGRDDLVAPPVGLFEQGQLGAGVGSFPAHDQAHPGRPTSQVH